MSRKSGGRLSKALCILVVCLAYRFIKQYFVQHKVNTFSLYRFKVYVVLLR